MPICSLQLPISSLELALLSTEGSEALIWTDKWFWPGKAKTGDQRFLDPPTQLYECLVHHPLNLSCAIITISYTTLCQQQCAITPSLFYLIINSGAISQIESVFKRIRNDFGQLEEDLEKIKRSLQKIWELVLTNESTRKIHRYLEAIIC